MRRVAAATSALCLLLSLGACGSSGSSATAGGSSTSGAATSTVATSTVPIPARGKPAPTTADGSPKVDKAPVYAEPTAAAPLRSGLVNVAYRFITIEPDTLRVKVGSTIRWTNFDSVEHNVTSQGGVQSFASKNFGKGGTFEIKANRPGVIHYLCTLHPTSMNGTIEVVR